ncbi:hypothetical protein B0T16DRAFT_207747 [Cercophora newfieldiana]|uniref:Uncharacterized protein n=1 Tax=Cercophora newfieldiana TaxID=92897 RepID=A0AA39XXY5_9PEZI|nr:hypothetical protein B0T16DRAFT_207747 [Cercophora newfieldiana]
MRAPSQTQTTALCAVWHTPHVPEGVYTVISRSRQEVDQTTAECYRGVGLAGVAQTGSTGGLATTSARPVRCSLPRSRGFTGFSFCINGHLPIPPFPPCTTSRGAPSVAPRFDSAVTAPEAGPDARRWPSAWPASPLTAPFPVPISYLPTSRYPLVLSQTTKMSTSLHPNYLGAPHEGLSAIPALRQTRAVKFLPKITHPFVTSFSRRHIPSPL